MNKLKRYLIFLVGLFINAFGVSFVTKASLGTSPISSIPYVLSLNFPLTLGNFTIIFSILLILLQIVILRKNFKIENILQIPVSIVFGYFIDLTMYMLFWVDPQNYLVKLAALLVGCIARLFGKHLEFIKPHIFPEDYAENADAQKVPADVDENIGSDENNDRRKNVIVIGRQYGSGGHDIGKMLAEKGNCVIIGRCSDYVLRDNKNVLKLFFTAPADSRVKRVMQRLGIDEKEAQKRIRREDKMRADNYRYYTGRMWGAAASFDMTVNTDLGTDYIEDCVRKLI